MSNSTAFINGNVYTVDSNKPRAEAFIVSHNGTFSHVGTTAAITTIAQSQHMVTHDLGGSFIMPGIHDAHCHMLFSALAMTSHAALPPITQPADLVEELKRSSCACKYTHTAQDWILGSTYAVPGFDRKVLDEAYPDTPVLIRGGAGHSAFLNSEALRRTGYDIAAEPDAQGTCFLRDADGALTGELAEMSLSKVMTRMPKAPLAHVKRVMLEAQQKLHAAGVTSIQEASANTAFLSATREMERDGALKLQVSAHIVYAPDWIAEETSEALLALLDRADEFASRHVDTRFVKIILDGVPLEPYWSHAGLEDGKVDERKLFITNVKEAVREYDARGMTMKIHCTGKGATRLTMDAFEAARKTNPSGPRHEVAHCSGVHDDEYPRFKALNVTAEMSPAFFFIHPITQANSELMNWDFGKMAAHGAHMTIGSDWGAGDAPDILPHLAGIIESVGSGDVVRGSKDVLRMLTLGGAEAIAREDEFGSITVGKKANFIAVDKDLSRGDFDGASVTKTWFEGEIVYERM